MLKILVKKISENVLLSTTYFLIAVLAFGGYYYYKLSVLNFALRNTLSETSARLSSAETKAISLEGELNAERERVDELSEQVGNITSTVGTLDKLAKTDKELLTKYSKVYFLNENYVPKKLSDVTEEYLVKKDEITTIHSDVKPFFEKMVERAKRDGINLRIISAYRSFDEQISLKSGYKVIYGAGTSNQFSADQGYSEHQLGTTIDFSTDTLGLSFTNFEKTPSYEWLLKNAYKYGFVLSYPKGNSYYQFEPWHWRFVGVELSEHLHDENKNFYDLDQREINEYLVKIFE